MGDRPRQVPITSTARGWAAAAASLLAGCQTAPTPTPIAVAVLEPEPARPAWESLLDARDRDRLGRIDQAWRQALAAARSAGFARRIAAEGPLLDPGGALPRAAPAPGSYRCRLIRLGAGPRRRASLSESASFCYVGVEGALLSLTRQTGATRPGGYLHHDSDTRLIFVGATARGREDVPPPYGTDPARNVSGVFERVGPFRYRLVVPWGSGGTLDLWELVPAAAQNR